MTRYFPWAADIIRWLVQQCTNRTDVRQVAGEFGTQAIFNNTVDTHMVTAIKYTHITGSGNLLGKTDASGTVDAAGHAGADKRAEIMINDSTFHFAVTTMRNAVLNGIVLQLTCPALITDRTIKRMMNQEILHHHLTIFLKLLGLGTDLHPLCNRCTAGCCRLIPPLNLNQAHTAICCH